jgi:hypothetical protein
MNTIKLRDILKSIEEDSSPASTAAKQRGLHHIGWGRYADKSGKLVAKSVDGQLVDLKPGELDPEVDQPPIDIDDMPDKSRPKAWRGWKPKATASEDDLWPYMGASQTNTGMMGSAWEQSWRKLPPGEVGYQDGNNPYVARNPGGKLAEFNNEVIAAAYATGNTLEGYDFDDDYFNSMDKLKTELKPLLDKLKSDETSTRRKKKIKGFLVDLIKAFVQGAGHRGNSSSKRKNPFGGGGGFSGGGSSGTF